ncbi:hypothetical protein AWZ03_005091 [Drosophila navojoa]|uniref:Uncharacterized protein n=1 Tax=Drosophila navojoa TaxID=7232 RepID=A0A484BIE6_DRONA|nr:hypothetical protein AWZ03_005091 [Drosophila navojoa]
MCQTGLQSKRVRQKSAIGLQHGRVVLQHWLLHLRQGAALLERFPMASPEAAGGALFGDLLREMLSLRRRQWKKIQLQQRVNQHLQQQHQAGNRSQQQQWQQ